MKKSSKQGIYSSQNMEKGKPSSTSGAKRRIKRNSSNQEISSLEASMKAQKDSVLNWLAMQTTSNLLDRNRSQMISPELSQTVDRRNFNSSHQVADVKKTNEKYAKKLGGLISKQETYSARDWKKNPKNALLSIPVIKNFTLLKIVKKWKVKARRKAFLRKRQSLAMKLPWANPKFKESIAPVFESLGAIRYTQVNRNQKSVGGKHGTMAEKVFQATQKKIERQMKELKKPFSLLIQQLELWGSQILCLKGSKKALDLTALSLLRSASEMVIRAAICSISQMIYENQLTLQIYADQFTHEFSLDYD
jgi:hypothetical protein